MPRKNWAQWPLLLLVSNPDVYFKQMQWYPHQSPFMFDSEIISEEKGLRATFYSKKSVMRTDLYSSGKVIGTIENLFLITYWRKTKHV